MEDVSEGLKTYLKLAGVPEDLSSAACLDLSNLGDKFRALLESRRCQTVVSIELQSLHVRERISELLRISGQFDFIFLQLDLFFDADLPVLRSVLRTRLKELGSVIVDTGISGSLFEKRWAPTINDGELLFVPTFQEVTQGIFEGFSVRDLGRIPDHVRQHRSSIFICRPFRPMVLLIGGPSGAGKTTLVREFSRSGIKVLSFDFLYTELLYHGKLGTPEALRELTARLDPTRIGSSIDRMVNDGLCEYLVDLGTPFFKLSERLTIAEGYQFSLPQIVRMTEEKLKTKGFRVQSLLLT